MYNSVLVNQLNRLFSPSRKTLKSKRYARITKFIEVPVKALKKRSKEFKISKNKGAEQETERD